MSGAPPDKEEIFVRLTGYMVELFELEPEAIRLSARLDDDLGLDSIDGVDLVVKLQDYVGHKIPAAEFKSIRTVGDVVDQMHALLAKPS